MGVTSIFIEQLTLEYMLLDNIKKLWENHSFGNLWALKIKNTYKNRFKLSVATSCVMMKL